MHGVKHAMVAQGGPRMQCASVSSNTGRSGLIHTDMDDASCP